MAYRVFYETINNYTAKLRKLFGICKKGGGIIAQQNLLLNPNGSISDFNTKRIMNALKQKQLPVKKFI